jgi:hypothetical protein
VVVLKEAYVPADLSDRVGEVGEYAALVKLRAEAAALLTRLRESISEAVVIYI